MKRRTLLKNISLTGLGVWLFPKTASPALKEPYKQIAIYNGGFEERRYWVGLLDKIATPLLSNLSQGTLRKNMEMQVSPVFDNRDLGVGYLEAFSRLAAGMAPWLSLADDDRRKYHQVPLLFSLSRLWNAVAVWTFTKKP